MIVGQFRRNTLEEWENTNPILKDGEFALIAENSNLPKQYTHWICGDGISDFKSLIKNIFNKESETYLKPPNGKLWKKKEVATDEGILEVTLEEII